MKIRKTFVGNLPDNKIVNSNSTSETDTYSCKYLNERNVIVSSEEPTTGEEVWVEKHNNIMTEIEENDINTETGEITGYGGFMITSNYIEVEPNTNYKSSYNLCNSDKKQICTYEYDENKTYLGFSFSSELIHKFKTKSNTKYLKVRYRDSSQSINAYLSKDVKKIYTKNDNGVYEEFYNEEEREVYSTGEQRIGTYLGKPLYRKTYSGITDTALKHGQYVAKGLTYIDKLVSHKGFITFVDSAKTFIHEIGCYESDIHFSGIQLYKDGGDLRIFGGDGYAIGSIYDVTIEYTKTTD